MINFFTKTGPFLFIALLALPLQGHEDDGPDHLIHHLRVGSAKGEPQAIYRLANEYARGKLLVKNEEKALELFRKAADLGNPAAQWTLAGRYSSGSGVEKDKVEAYKWALVSIENGSEVARKLISNFEQELSPDEKEKGKNLATQWQENFLKKEPKK